VQVRVRFEVEQNYRGWRLDAYLAQKIRRLTPEKIAFLIAHRLEHDGSCPGRPSEEAREPEDGGRAECHEQRERGQASSADPAPPRLPALPPEVGGVDVRRDSHEGLGW